MSSEKVKIEGINAAISKIVDEYSDEVKKAGAEAADIASKQAVSVLKKTSPKRTGKYRRSWTRKKIARGYIVHNKTYYRLTHLLNNGHAKRNGGRVPGDNHITNAETETVKLFIEEVESRL